MDSAAVVILVAAWGAVLATARAAQRWERAEVDLKCWRIDILLPDCSAVAAAAHSSRARQRLRRWFDLGTVAALCMAVYAVALLTREAAVLVRRLGMAGQPQAAAAAAEAAAAQQLQLAVPGVTLPLGHATYIWLAVIVAMAVHEAGHALAAAAEEVRLLGAGLAMTLLIPAAYVLLDEGDLNRLGRWPGLRVACAGAWHNAVLSALCWAALAGAAAAGGALAAAVAPGQPLALLLGYTGAVSAALGLLNMAPVHCLDGATVVRTLLGCRSSSSSSTVGGGTAVGLLPQALWPEKPGERAAGAAWRRRAAAWVLHVGTAGLAAVLLLHVSCLKWCTA